MVSEEAQVYLEIAKEQFEDAKLAFRNRRLASCCLLYAMSAENATSALILKLGGKPSKKHRNSLVLHKLIRSVNESLRPNILKLIDLMKKLEPHVIKPRYPIRKGPRLLPPF